MGHLAMTAVLWEKTGLWPPGLTAEQLRTVTRPALHIIAGEKDQGETGQEAA
jgi:hypothetical protein